MRHSIFLPLLFILTLSFGAAPVSAGTIEAQVLQFKLDRFYFNVGKESLVYPGHHFAIIRGKDTVVSGLIEESYDGVSIGRGALPRDGKRNFEKYKAAVETAEVERIHTFHIGTYATGLYLDNSADTGESGRLGGKTGTEFLKSIVHVLGADTVVEERFDDTLLLFDGLDRHRLDAIVYAGAPGNRPGYRVVTARAPFFAVLLPNVGSQVNKDGELTTSLYYRFDPQRISALLTQDCEAKYSFLISDSTVERQFPYDVDKGKKLFRDLPARPISIRLGLGSESLRPVAMYFADILAREQCRTEIVPCKSGCDCDLAVTYLPRDRDQYSALMKAVEALGRLNSGGVSSLVVGPLSNFRDELIRTDSIVDSLNQRPSPQQADRMLIDQWGCFPLFRPSCTMVMNQTFSGIRFNDEGRLVISEPKRVILPPALAKEGR